MRKYFPSARIGAAILLVCAYSTPFASTIEETASGIGIDTESACYQALTVAQMRAHQKSEKYIRSSTSSLEESRGSETLSVLFQQKTRTIESKLISTGVKKRELSINQDGLVKCTSTFEFSFESEPIRREIEAERSAERERLDFDRTREAIYTLIRKNTEDYVALSDKANTIANVLRISTAKVTCKKDDISACDHSINIMLAKEIKQILRENLEIDESSIDAAVHRHIGSMHFTTADNNHQTAIWRVSV